MFIVSGSRSPVQLGPMLPRWESKALTNSGFFNPGSGRFPRQQFESAMSAIAAELEELVDSMEAELRETGSFSPENIERLHELRMSLEQLFGRGGG